MTILVLGSKDIDEIITMDLAIEAVEAAFTGLANGQVQNLNRQRIKVGESAINNMTASDQTKGYFGLKSFTNVHGHGHMMVLLFSIETGELEALIGTPKLGATRTGAASGVATRWMSRKDSKILTVIGAGRQATTQVEAIVAVRDIKQVRVVDTNQERMINFATQIINNHSIEAYPFSRVDEAVQGADIITTVTTSNTPVLLGEWVDKGSHINIIGSNRPHARELDGYAFKRAESVVTDSIDQAKNEAGDLISAVQEGFIDWNNVFELSEVVSHVRQGRTSDDGITIFKSVGIAAQDICLASRLLEKARLLGKGFEIDMQLPKLTSEQYIKH